MDPQQYFENDGSRILDNQYVRPGYIFIGWNTKANGTGQWIDVNSLTDQFLGSDVTTLYAQWQKVENEQPVPNTYVETTVQTGVESVTGFYGTSGLISALGIALFGKRKEK